MEHCLGQLRPTRERLRAKEEPHTKSIAHGLVARGYLGDPFEAINLSAMLHRDGHAWTTTQPVRSASARKSRSDTALIITSPSAEVLLANERSVVRSMPGT